MTEPNAGQPTTNNHAATYALDWLATRLDTTIGDPTSDGNIVSTWDQSHWLTLKAALDHVDRQDHKTIDTIFADYARANRLLDEPFLAAREARIKKEHWYGYVDEISKPNHADAPERRSSMQRVAAALRTAFHL
jgi:hypothetical protein